MQLALEQIEVAIATYIRDAHQSVRGGLTLGQNNFALERNRPKRASEMEQTARDKDFSHIYA